MKNFNLNGLFTASCWLRTSVLKATPSSHTVIIFTTKYCSKILISEHDFTVNVVMVINIAIHKAFISHDLLLKET